MDFKFTDEYGNKVSFRGYKHKILYINFWATWCAPCIKRIPELNNLIGKYEDNPSIAFMNICVDSDKDKFNL
jgi:thiol-disulfide isomerase/thioredoxin